jgi:hypothetical protein
MTEADAFRQFAKEATQDSLSAEDKNEKDRLSDLALVWTQAAVASDKVFGPRPALPPYLVETSEPLRSLVGAGLPGPMARL